MASFLKLNVSANEIDISLLTPDSEQSIQSIQSTQSITDTQNNRADFFEMNHVVYHPGYLAINDLTPVYLMIPISSTDLEYTFSFVATRMFYLIAVIFACIIV